MSGLNVAVPTPVNWVPVCGVDLTRCPVRVRTRPKITKGPIWMASHLTLGKTNIRINLNIVRIRTQRNT